MIGDEDQNFDGILNKVKTDLMKKACRVAFSPFKCLASRPGYLINLELSRRSVIPNYGVIHKDDFDQMDEKMRNSVLVVESNLKTKYLVTCPYSCKKKDTFFDFLDVCVIFSFLGKTCGLDLKCSTCPDNRPAEADGNCSVEDCSQIQFCKESLNRD